MASVVGICNRALSRLGDKRILSLTEDSKPARACNSAWEPTRDEVLREHPWNCIVERASLAALATAPDFGFDNQYQLPVDCERVLEVIDLPPTWPWVVEGRKILCDLGAPLDIRYIKRETDPNQYDSLLRSVLAARMAVELAEEITQSKSKRELEEARYAVILSQAKAVDGQEQSPQDFEEDTWILARL